MQIHSMALWMKALQRNECSVRRLAKVLLDRAAEAHHTSPKDTEAACLPFRASKYAPGSELD